MQHITVMMIRAGCKVCQEKAIQALISDTEVIHTSACGSVFLQEVLHQVIQLILHYSSTRLLIMTNNISWEATTKRQYLTVQ